MDDFGPVLVLPSQFICPSTEAPLVQLDTQYLNRHEHKQRGTCRNNNLNLNANAGGGGGGGGRTAYGTSDGKMILSEQPPGSTLLQHTPTFVGPH